ncbi:MAG: MATE family efflux transporter [Lachnospiraceae bacterium]|nr:MATE family efflux transporter [Lachnospiraceae bacterium]
MNRQDSPLGYKPVGALLRQFAIPSIIAMLVGALYNIVDQFFIGQKIGELGNAATNIAFPLSISCTSIALLFGIGGASAFNLAMGEGDRDTAPFYIGNSASASVICGVLLSAVTLVFLKPMMLFFGSPADVFPYACEYTGITAWGFPMLILQAGGAHLVRADGSPRYSMLSNLTGAVINTVLDALFVFGFEWGMKGAALATVIGQCVSAAMVIVYLCNYKTVKLKLMHFIPRFRYFLRSASLGTASFFNQIANMIIQIVLNNSLKVYGEASVYGSSIPIACVGIISKVGMMFFSFIIGISQGLQPIVSFNFGAKQFKRVKDALLLALKIGFLISLGSFFVFQVFPRRIIGLFGEGSEEYFTFAVKYFRIYFFFIFINFVQPVVSNFFTATGRPQRGMFLSLTRQILFLLPLILILPLFFGIDGIIYSGPIADAVAATVTIIMAVVELRNERYKM